MNPEKREREGKIFNEDQDKVVNEIAKDIFHEGCHGEDFGSGKFTPREIMEHTSDLDNQPLAGHVTWDDPREVEFAKELASQGDS